ncbi:MAG: bifunctional serine/threonine-protein kinase/formylglycine-generating enzyme family protein, partial [Planctomycetota bacterium]
MKESDLFNELIAIADLRQRSARLEQIARSHPEMAESLRKLLEHYEPDEDFLSTNALDRIAQLPNANVVLEGLKHFQVRKRYNLQDLSHDFLEPSDQPNSIGKIGGYEVQSLIGFGGSARVYKGTDPELDKIIAIKTLHTDQANDRIAIGRLQKEARAMGRIKHENVVEVYRISIDPIPLIAMEYVDGESLDQLITRDGMLGVDRFFGIAKQILRGVQAAHDLGWVHRDLKPANILLANGSPTVAKITDFGLVRREKDSRLTRSGTVVGTPRYMSPEQIRDETLDARSDLFSLGAVFYEMLTGVSAFQGESQYAEMYSVLHSMPTSFDHFRSDVPVGVERLVYRMLEKDPMRRYQSAAEILQVLESRDWEKPGDRRTLIPSLLESRSSGATWLFILTVTASSLLLSFVLPRSPKKTQVMPQVPGVSEKTSEDRIQRDSIQQETAIDHPWTRELRLPFSNDVAREYQQRWADALGIAVESENQFGIRFVLIPPGEFLMGYSSEDFDRLKKENANDQAELQMIRASSKPTWVRISFPFYISKYEITEAQRARVLGTDHSLPSVLDLEYAPVRPRANSEEHPVTRVPWEEAQSICQRMNQKGGLDSWDGPVAQNQLGRGLYRLPTEAEWEWACRAGRSGGSIADPKELDEEVWMNGNTPAGVQLRGLKKPNAFGLHDLLGNVQEWCLDNFDENYFAGNSASDPLVNPLARTEHPHFRNGHVLRGGS